MDIKDETKELVKRASVLIYIGELDVAELLLLRALYNTSDCGEKTEAATYLPRIHHRMGQLEAARGNVDAARELFELAEGSFTHSNVIGRARTLRDQAWLSFRQGQPEEGNALAKGARNLLKRTTEVNPQWEKEFLVTDSIVAGTDLKLSQQIAVRKLLRIDEQLKGGSDPIYERENLIRLMRYLPLTGRMAYELRSQSIWWRLIAGHEVRTITQDLMEGNLRAAALGPARRMTRHLLPF